MKKKQLFAGLLAMALVLTSTANIPSVNAKAKARAVSGTTYYVSTVDGKDSNDGLSESKAFYSLDKINQITLKPGDKVLLKSGSVFTDGYLHIKGSGSEEAPIQIGKYGTGAAPVISTNGEGVWYQDYGKQLDSSGHKYKGYVSSSILLYDVEYIEIRDLEITNKATDIENSYNQLDVMNRTGVAAVAQNIGTVDHIYLDNLYIHDVIGNVYDKHMNNGGIYFTESMPKDEATGVAKYNDIKIENCQVDNVNRWGIAVGYTYNWDKFLGGEISDEVAAEYGSTNVEIRNNYVKDAGGDAITTMYCDRPIIEYNVSDGAARQINPTDYSETNSGRVAAAVWPWKCKDAVFQYNEVFDTCQNQDGQAWDADWGDGTIYQYNYSHNNGGGSVMFCGYEAINNIFRYNISQNDLGGVINPAGQPDAHVYNNTFYVKEGIDFIRENMGGGPMVVENNIIYYSGAEAKEENWFKHTDADNTLYDNNIYYNYTAVPSNDANAITEDPLFVDGGKAPTTAAAKVHERKDFEGYKLQAASPAINAGKVIADNGGKDFFGNEVKGIPDIGAFESDVFSMTLLSDVYEISSADKTINGLEENTSVEDFLKNVSYDISSDEKCTVKIMDGDKEVTTGTVKSGMKVVLAGGGQEIVYTIAANANNTLEEAIYMVKDGTMYVPALENNATSVKEVKDGVKVHNTATVKIVDADGKEVEDTADIADGMKLVITAENGDNNTYVIEVRNTYNWALDYAGPQQGNVWFGQMRNSETEYTNLDKYDPKYPQWIVDGYFGPGLDLDNHYIVPDENTHGLLMDTTGGSKKEGMAMAYRAPKTGKITISVKDDEPYLRQDGNANGSVTLSFTKNGEVLGDTYTLEESKVKVDVGTRELTVNKGDWIRIEAKNNGTPSRPSIHITPTITYVDEEVDVPVVTPEEPTEDSVVVNWTPVENATGYNIYVNGKLYKSVSGDVALCSIEGLLSGTEYTISVAAFNDNNEEFESEEITVTTKGEEEAPDTEAPSKPGNVKAENIGKTEAKLTWDASTDNKGVVGYKVYCGKDLFATITDGGTFLELRGLIAGTEYTFSVIAYDLAGNESEAEKVTFTTLADSEEPELPDEKAPSKPEDLKVGKVDKTSVLITWEESADNVVKYEVFVDGKSLGFRYTNSAEIIGLVPGTEYEVEIVAIDADGNRSKAASIKVKTKADETNNNNNNNKPDDNKGTGTTQPSLKPVTGDQTSAVTWGVIFMLAIAAGAAVIIRKRKSQI